MPLDPNVVRQAIGNLRLTHPELMEDDEAWLLAIESETEFNELITGVLRRIEDSKALVIGTKDRLEELEARKKRFEHRIETLRDLLFNLLQSASLPKLELPEATLSIRNIPPAVMITDESRLPDIACKFERKPDKTKIKELLSVDPFYVAGATMSNGGKTISIKIK